MYTRVHWQDGALLTAKHFKTQDLLQQQNIFQSISLPYQMHYGILKLHLDIRLLQLGTVKINELEVYTKEHRLIKVSQDTALKFSLEEANTSSVVSIYLSLSEENTDKNGLTTTQLLPTLTDNIDNQSIECLKLFEVVNINDVWQLNNYSTGLISCDSYTFIAILNDIDKLVSSLTHFAAHQQQNPHTYYLLQLQIHEFCRLLNSIKSKPIHFHPNALFNAIESLYYMVSTIENAPFSEIIYDFYQPNKSFTELLQAFYELLKKPIKQQFVALEKENNAYIATELDAAFVNATQYYLVIRKRNEQSAPDINIKHLKLSSVERNKHVNQMSLSGIPLERLPNNGIHQLHDAFVYQTYRLIPGSELDYTLREKNIMFKNIENAQHYQFFLYYR
ncbi:type VI secretion system baseplate subunit TssK [Fangia hongkongensis]|uniref:type VI secretion system baseplate subunit TssK n=1 Tax=Fangia hongkongensis TaxID=270495 RepID=UPI000369A892|nr:type VI secretion system baseplate subunit TssK [Fangia hongkongensis]MBK2125034.1 type VI secretion system baseplate subunit TssK [Fangia hongkongensis]